MRLSEAIKLLTDAQANHGDQQLRQWVYSDGKVKFTPMQLEVSNVVSEGGIGIILTKVVS